MAGASALAVIRRQRGFQLMCNAWGIRMTDNEVVTTQTVELSEAEMRSRRTLTLIIYILQGLAFFIGLTALVGIIMNYVKCGDMRGTWLESHFRWQIRTFWYVLLWMVLGILLAVVWIGYIILFVNAVWAIYRIVRGVLNLLDNKPMYT